MSTLARVTHIRTARGGLLCTVRLTDDDDSQTEATVHVRIAETLLGDEAVDVSCVYSSHLTDEQERAAVLAVSECGAVGRAVRGES